MLQGAIFTNASLEEAPFTKAISALPWQIASADMHFVFLIFKGKRILASRACRLHIKLERVSKKKPIRGSFLAYRTKGAYRTKVCQAFHNPFLS